jgi:hypothetical protein
MENEDPKEEIVEEEDPDPTFYDTQPPIDTALAEHALEQAEKLVQTAREVKRLVVLSLNGRGDIPTIVRYRRVLANLSKYIGVMRKDALTLKDDIAERRTKGRHPRIAKKKKKQDL